MSNPKITLIGRIGTSPEPIGSGIRFRMATNDRVKTESGAWEDRDTSWWTVKAWKSLADQSKNTLKKGQEIIVNGTIKEDNWVGDDGQKRTSYEVTADSIAITTYSLSKDVLAVPSNFASAEPTNPADDVWAIKV